MDYLNPESINGLNQYAYCSNNPVNLCDPSGHFAISTLIIGLAFGFAGTMITDLLDDGKVFNGSQDWRDYLGNTLASGIGGLAGAFGLNMLGSMIYSVAGDTIGGLISGDINSWSSFGQTVALSPGMPILLFGISKGVSDAYGNAHGKGQYRRIRGFPKKIIKVNNYLKNLTGSYKKAGVSILKIGANSVDDFIKAFSKTTSNVVTEIVGNIISTSIGLWL